MLHPDIMLFLKKAAECGLRVDLETSASRYRPGSIRSLAQAGLKVLCLSLDGDSAEIHDTFRGVAGLYEKVLAAAAEGVGAGLDVRVYCSVSPVNIDSALGIIDLFEERNLDIGGITFAPVTPVGRAEKNGSLQLSREDWKAFYSAFEVRRGSARINMRIERMVIGVDELRMFKALFPHDFSCIARERRYMYVNPQGHTYGCSLLTGGAHSLGSVRETRLSDIWLSSQGWEYFGPRPKNDSELLEACRQGCPALSGRSHLESSDTLGSNSDVMICPRVQTPQIDNWTRFEHSN